jgi:hypothetical protein
MKVMFLDIDGVLNSSDNMSAQANLWHIDNKHKSRDKFGHLFDERCVRWLQYIIYKTNCKIVISSTWRYSGLEEMKKMWEERNLPGEIIDITPDCSNLRKSGIYIVVKRGDEIEKWLTDNKENVDSYVIVDDDDDMLEHQHLVKTDTMIGLNYETSNKIIEYLK